MPAAVSSTNRTAISHSSSAASPRPSHLLASAAPATATWNLENPSGSSTGRHRPRRTGGTDGTAGEAGGACSAGYCRPSRSAPLRAQIESLLGKHVRAFVQNPRCNCSCRLGPFGVLVKASGLGCGASVPNPNRPPTDKSPPKVVPNKTPAPVPP